MKYIYITLIGIVLSGSIHAQPTAGNTISKQPKEEFTATERPWLWWYWLGSAVTKEGIAWHLDQFKQLGYGGASIAATYGVKGFEKDYIPFMGSRWIEMLSYTTLEAKKRAMGIDMSLTSAWPFGGPNVTKDMAARYVNGGRLFGASANEVVSKKIYEPDKEMLGALSAYSTDGVYLDLTQYVDKNGILHYTFPNGKWDVYSISSRPTGQTTKRSGMGGEGLVLDHFDKKAVEKYLERYDSLFIDTNYLRSVFNDSYEVYGADYTPSFLDEFRKRRGYDLRAQLNHLFSESADDAYRRVLCDYRETISDLLLDNFVKVWSAWANRHGVKTVEQAHGSPANWIDLYAASDIPQAESFGASPLHIKGVRIDPVYDEKIFGRPDKMLLKFASSASNIMGKKYTSSESATWLGNHFNIALSQVKPQVDELFISGINHIMLTCGAYSPPEIEFPGWRFYPAADFGHTTTFKNETAAFSLFVARSQKMLQNSRSDNEVLLYFPIHDRWTDCQDEDGRSKLMMFTIHNPDNWFYKGDFGSIARNLKRKGYDFDYISDRQIAGLKFVDGELVTQAGIKYKTIVIPSARHIPLETIAALKKLGESGAKIIFAYRTPSDVPGYFDLEKRRSILKQDISDIKALPGVYTGADYLDMLVTTGCHKENFGENNLEYIRKVNDKGTFYYVANQSNDFEEGWIETGQKFTVASLYDPLTGKTGLAKTEGNRIFLQLKAGQSCIIKLHDDTEGKAWDYFYPQMSKVIEGTWKVSFRDGQPVVPQPFETKNLYSWALSSDTMSRYFSGIGRYETEFDLPVSMQKNVKYMISLGDVREVADVWINDVYIGSAWSVPFELTVEASVLKPKGNRLRIEVRNLDANRMIWIDKQKIPWQNYFFVDVAYNGFDASKWAPVASGLLGKVVLTSSNNR